MPAPQKNGVQWAETQGKVSTTATGKAIWVAAIEGLTCGSESTASAARALAEQIKGEKNWRHKYSAPVREVCRLQTCETEACYASCEAGLKAAHQNFFFAKDGMQTPLLEAAEVGEAGLQTHAVKGIRPASDAVLSIPVGAKNYSGAEAKELVAGWARYGTCEPSLVDAVGRVTGLSGEELVRSLAGKVFVLLGATSAAGPALPLLRAGATVAAVARRGAKLNALIEEARQTPGTLLLPVESTPTDSGEGLYSVAGADVIAQMPKITTWLRTLEPHSKLVIGSYIYLDGEAHVRATMGMDAIITTVYKARPGTMIGYLCSPATVHPIPMEAHQKSVALYENQGVLARLNPFWWTSFEKNAEPLVRSGSAEIPVTDGLSVLQGPNYALAKTMQHWRCVLARRDGVRVSAKMGPPMYTESMVHVEALRVGLNGMQGFAPLAGYQPETASGTLAMAFINDITDESSTANPKLPLDNPLQLFCHGGLHGGSWRCAFKQESIQKAMYVLGKTAYRSPPDAPPRA